MECASVLSGPSSQSWHRWVRSLALALLVVAGSAFVSNGQVVTIDTSASGRGQVIDGFGTCLAGNEGTNDWWQQLYFDDLGASMVRVDLTPNFRSPYSDNAYNSPTWGNAGPDGYYARAYTNAADYSRMFSGRSAPVAVMGPNIETNIGYFVFPSTPGSVAQAGFLRRLQLGDFKLFGSLWSPAPWVKLSSGNSYGGSSFGMPAKGTPWPFIWLGNFAGGKLDVSGTPQAIFDDSSLGGSGPTSALTQFARCTAAYVKGFQRAYHVQFYALSIQNELNFEEFYNSCTYPLASQYIAALKAVRAEFDRYPDLAAIKLMGPEDLMGGDPYSLWQYGSGATTVQKNLQDLQNIAGDPAALAAIGFFCIHGYANDGVTSSGANPTQWNWWLNGWTSSPAAGLPSTVKGTAGYGKKSWMTETSGEAPAWLSPASGFPGQGAWSIGLKIHQALTAGAQSAWAYWQFTDGNAVSASTLTDATQRTNSAKYVAAKHFFRFIRPNAVRVAASVGGATGLNASAYLAPSNSAITIVLVNSASNSVAVHVQVPAVPAGLTRLFSFTSDATNLWVSNSVTASAGVFNVSVPAFGICTLVSSITGGLPPAVTRNPQSASVTSGSNLIMSCSVTGDGPLSYQWSFNNLPITNATAAVLTLTNVQPFQSGQYTVEVSNGSGSISSIPAQLTVTGLPTLNTPDPLIDISPLGPQLQLSFLSNVGRIYSWWTSTDQNSWSLATNFVSARTDVQWTVVPSLVSPALYFRASSP